MITLSKLKELLAKKITDKRNVYSVSISSDIDEATDAAMFRDLERLGKKEIDDPNNSGTYLASTGLYHYLFAWSCKYGKDAISQRFSGLNEKLMEYGFTKIKLSISRPGVLTMTKLKNLLDALESFGYIVTGYEDKYLKLEKKDEN